MRDFLEVVVVGIGNGAVYAMLGLGLVVIYRSTGLLNFAQGELSMFSTFIVWTINSMGVPLWLSVLGGMAGGFLVGILLHQVAVAPLGDPHEKPLAVVIVTIALFLAINGAAQLIWGTVDKRLDPLFGQAQVTIGGVAIQWQKIGSVVVLAALTLAFVLLFQRTKLGLAMRAVAPNSESAGLCGVPVPRILMLGWGSRRSRGNRRRRVHRTPARPWHQHDAAHAHLRLRSDHPGRVRQHPRGGRRRHGGRDPVIGGPAVRVVLRTDAARSRLRVDPRCAAVPAAGPVRIQAGAARMTSTGSSTSRLARYIGAAVMAVVLVALPFMFPAFRVNQFITWMCLAVAAAGLNLLTGYNGQISVGHGALYGLGAYTSAILVTEAGWPMLLTVVAAAAVCFVAGVAIGLPALRIKGLYLALVTLRWPCCSRRSSSSSRG
ncbi:MAG: hypothetical protein M5U19_08455 [Microthrixaceae bacterium]|nr:hypothetical protein [Microthrixaceae bacterium]